ncbi:hypothetical protein MAPG_00068 [Magnaporthiopsis poae ATCC 64411]|uniref:Kinesin motor domain-containing protein n=1 Tax=Magnaporthiopsis poae (strain ATCC 64411 / 73-15) TaxID=644358 RepID=A0A0C4DK06_MAGP6|nr:hypothetical protein MAPG_00068 [Magnaporthiopsis poae ATCC 64411]
MDSPFAPSAAAPAFSPPVSPGTPVPQRPLSAMVRPAPRSNSRTSNNNNRSGGGSRASDEDARTSVRVAVRIRPPLQPTDPGFDLIPQRFQRSMVQVTSDTSLTIDAPQGRKLFVFDRVFGSEVGQEGVFDYVSDCVNAFTQGYNVSLLAYGQSGAGKSYTMGTSGPLEQDDLEMMGVIPRAAFELFEKLDGGAAKPVNANRSSMSHLRTPARYSTQSTPRAEKNWSLKATYVEIYNEQLRDLLLPDTVPAHERSAVTIREDVKGNILLTGLRQVEINSVDDLMAALNLGSALRQTDATAINARSSRSHAVFSLNLVLRNKKVTSAAEKRFSVPLEAMSGTEPWVTTDSKLHFVDLAGSERLKNTGAQGERAKEGISINAGLAALGKVISQLSSRQAGSHVSYRDSRLTRLLQDSLGGNAITYMIACVTPAEFHLSETLNTVQYAQRARAIQSKPRIQQIEEGDKQAIIDRLKAEVAFLRDQIRSAERGGADRRVLATGERSERQSEREAELQNQLLDFQENYTNLSQRHAKLISEMAKARDNEYAESQQQLEESLGDSATARLNRSNSFAQAVEQVVLEYEKTIQSLEQSLSNTRATLANTETSLLEKETKCAYVETISNQLQARLQKLMDREASTETYLHELEAKLDGHTSGEEKNATLLVELRKEIARVRESEATAEEYISTLEERLAEADQDAELMQREIDRLEQVIERQRSLGKLDSLLYELDHIHQDAKEAEAEPEAELANGAASHRRSGSRSRSGSNHSRSQSHVSRLSSQREDAIPEEDDTPEETPLDNIQETSDDQSATAAKADSNVGLSASHHADNSDYPPSPAQSRFVADKLETVSQELVDLRVEHEATVTDFELLQAKYEEAIRVIAELQDSIDESRHVQRTRDSVMSLNSPNTRPSSLFSDPRSSMTKDGRHFSTPQSLSTELTSALGSPAVDGSGVETLNQHHRADSTASTNAPAAAGSVPVEDSADANSRLKAELGRLKALAAEKESAEKEIAAKYAQLEEEHNQTLDMVEDLRTKVAKAQAIDPSLPRTGSPLIRRKSSQTVMLVDRAHRSFATLRNIATENLEHQPDIMQNFNVNLEAAMHELHSRSERIQQLEADVATAKKEMETKMTIISGLTRERSSLKSSPMDISVIATLKDQLEKNEKERKEMQEAHSTREAALQSQLDALRSEVEASKSRQGSAGEHDGRIEELQAELSKWEDKHQKALEAMQATEQEMKKTIVDLESQLAAMSASTPPKDEEGKQQNMVAFLQSEIDEYKAIISSNATKVAELEQGHAATKTLLEETSKSRELSEAELESHKALVSQLEQQLSQHEQAVKAHQEELQAMQTKQADEVEKARAASAKEHDEIVQRLLSEHSENLQILQGELTEAREDLMKVATQVAYALGLDVSVEAITDRINSLISDQKALAREQQKSADLERTAAELSGVNDTIMRELEAVKSTLTDLLLTPGEALRSPFPSIHDQLSAVRQRMADLDNRNRKNSRLVEELEDQLQSNFDQAQIATNRLSTLQSEQQVRVDEANAARIRVQSELDTIKEEYAALQAKMEGVLPPDVARSNSLTSGLRKSSSVTSLPSPPPAIPLPPLPGSSGSPPGPGGVPATPTQGRPPSKDLAMSQIQQDQEARIRTIEKHLSAEKQLTATLEEALTDLEEQSKKVKSDCEAWRKRCTELEGEIRELRDKPQQDPRWSVHAVEEERRKRRDAELANQRLEERMNAISKKNKKKGSLNCF